MIPLLYLKKHVTTETIEGIVKEFVNAEYLIHDCCYSEGHPAVMLHRQILNLFLAEKDIQAAWLQIQELTWHHVSKEKILGHIMLFVKKSL